MGILDVPGVSAVAAAADAQMRADAAEAAAVATAAVDASTSYDVAGASAAAEAAAIAAAALDATTKADAATTAAAQRASNLSDLASAATSRTNLGLGTAATTAATDYDVTGAAAAAEAAAIAAAAADATAKTDLLVAKGDEAVNLGKQTGVDPTGVTECAAAINTVMTAAAAAGVRVFGRGTYRIASTVTITGNVDLSDAVFSWTGPSNGTAVQVGSGVTGAAGIMYRAVVNLPRVLNANKTVNGWAQNGVTGTSGVKLVNCYACQIHVPHVRSFVDGLYQYGTGTGHVYNVITVGHLENNQRNERLGADATGWCNDNTIVGGFRQHLSAEGVNVPGVRQILIEVAANPVNTNRWYGGSVEGSVAEYHVDCSGVINVFNDVRWEVPGGARVRWGVGATDNVVNRGYMAHQIVETFDPAVGFGNIVIARTTRVRASGGTAGLAVYENGSSSANPVDTIMAAGAAVAGADPTTAYLVQRSGNQTSMKRAADAADRLRLDHVNGRLYLGNGVAAPVAYLSATASTLLAFGAPFAPGADNTQDNGIAALRWRYIRAGTAIQTGNGPTASRPSAVTAGAGAQFYDTTINRMVFSNGFVWDDPLVGVGGTVPEPGIGGFLGWSFDPSLFTASGPVLTSGVLTGARVWIPQAATVTNLVLTVGIAAATLTAGQSFAALYDTAGALLGVTADQSTAWTITGTKFMPLVGGPQVLNPGFYDICFWSVGVTPPRFAAGATGSSAVNGGLSAANSRYFTADTGLTTTAPANRAARAALTTAHFVAVT